MSDPGEKPTADAPEEAPAGKADEGTGARSEAVVAAAERAASEILADLK